MINVNEAFLLFLNKKLIIFSPIFQIFKPFMLHQMSTMSCIYFHSLIHLQVSVLIELSLCFQFNPNLEKESVIPLFHTGHESPESPRIDFFLIRGDS